MMESSHNELIFYQILQVAAFLIWGQPEFSDDDKRVGVACCPHAGRSNTPRAPELTSLYGKVTFAVKFGRVGH